MILLETIQKRIEVFEPTYPNFDCRYMQRWINKYPTLFPQYVRDNNYNITFNHIKLRYEINKILKTLV